MIVYAYTINGGAADDQTWTLDGEVTVVSYGQFFDAIQVAMQSSFKKLTRGEAEFGKPGVGCNGPYRVISFTIKEKGKGDELSIN